MKNKALIGGAIALGIIVLIAVLCFWVGKKGLDNLRGDTNTTETTRPDGRRPPPSAPSTAPNSAEEAAATYLALGNPSNASATDPNNYLLVNNYFVVSYNRDRAIPNWAAWRISSGEIGAFPRPEPDPFRPDDRLPKNWKRATPSDYTGSGFDRGHLSPSADRSASVEGMTATFLMTNMTPQTGDLNRGPWQKLEAYLRTLVTRGSDVYIYAGVYGEKGKLKNKVSIPTNDWKIAVAVPAGTPISQINEGNARVIAVDMPNVKGILRADWQVYRTTVRQIEQNTGYNLLSALPQNVQDALETKADTIND
ncbi:MAG TPA: DNA/RNA non-specific endonuclease [Pyrinomonadaceae bacterium]|jgi:endonuclease G